MHGDPLLASQLHYSAHSGSGVQLQALTAAAFLANATGHALLVPPWLMRNDMSTWLWDPRTMGRRCRIAKISPEKHLLAEQSTRNVCDRLCRNKNHADSMLQTGSWMQMYDLRSIARIKVQTCDDCPGCRSVDLDTHMLYHGQEDRRLPNRSMRENCTRLEHEMRSYSGWCHQRMLAVSSASARVRQRGRTALCVGPLNDFLFSAPYGHQGTILGGCSGTHPLARTLDEQGLPLRHEVLAAVQSLLPDACDLCIYSRLSDRKPESQPAELSELLRRRLALMAPRMRGLAGQIEMVSSCSPLDACREALLGTTRNTTLALDYARLLDRVAWRVGAEKHLVAELGQALRLGLEKARIAFDVLRCARCRTIAPASSRSSKSTFYQMIRRTHKRLYAMGPPNAIDIANHHGRHDNVSHRHQEDQWEGSFCRGGLMKAVRHLQGNLQCKENANGYSTTSEKTSL